MSVEFASSGRAAPQGKLETPTPGSAQSGIGLIRGWVCSANRVDIEVVGRGSLTAVYGEAREDTQATCGDSNNGFSLQFNWNDLGEGVHTVRALADGEEFARAAVTVGRWADRFFWVRHKVTFLSPTFPPMDRRRACAGWRAASNLSCPMGGRLRQREAVRGRMPSWKTAVRARFRAGLG